MSCWEPRAQRSHRVRNEWPGVVREWCGRRERSERATVARRAGPRRFSAVSFRVPAGAERSGVEDPAGVGAVSTWVTIGHHVGVRICLFLAQPLSAVVPGTSSALEERTAPTARGRIPARRDETAQRARQGSPVPNGSARNPFPGQRPRRLPRGTKPLPDIRQFQSGCVRTSRVTCSRICDLS